MPTHTYNINGENYTLSFEVMEPANCGTRVFHGLSVCLTSERERGVTLSPVPVDMLSQAFEWWWENDVDYGKKSKFFTWFVAPVDYRAPTAPNKQGSSNQTQNLVQWLIDVKKQWVFTSPVFANKNYEKKTASLNQGAWWIPEFLVADNRVLSDSSEEFNTPPATRFPTQVNTLAERFEENFDPTFGVIKRFTRAQKGWEDARGFIDGKPPIKNKRTINWL